ncbi:hypothetical protein NKDENANG_03675 [Candidatus Entotheonellaceae bacterium PAL068K]
MVAGEPGCGVRMARSSWTESSLEARQNNVGSWMSNVNRLVEPTRGEPEGPNGDRPNFRHPHRSADINKIQVIHVDTEGGNDLFLDLRDFL